MTIFFLILSLFLAGLIGWTLRSTIAEKEHEYRWWVEGCRHNIGERWRLPQEDEK